MRTGSLLVAIGCMACCCYAADIVGNETGAMAYLNQFGYMDSGDMQGGLAKTDEIKRKAIQYFQLFVNITMTGELDDDTYAMMNKPRCGMSDMISDNDMVRRKRYALGTRWDKTDLTYRIDGRTPDLPAADVDRIMNEALKAWSDVSRLTFREVSAGQPADILINFFRGDHGDGNSFDGPSGVLAHAYFPTTNPIGGDAHFDEDETYTDKMNSGINLFQVAAHEFGHSLGLRHSQVEGALMFPYYQGYVADFELHSDDIAGIQAHYGENVGQPEGMGTPSTPVDDCMADISIATQTNDGSTYLANATHVFRILNSAIPNGYPRRIGDEFPGLPDKLDAALYYQPNGRTYIFKGSQYWRLNNQAIDAGYPRSIAGSFRRLPDDLSSAFIWSGNGRIYFTKGDQYYRYTPGYGVDQNYPRPLSTWRGLPATVDAVFQYSNSRTYFFSGSDYYLFDDRNFQVAPGYPQPTAVNWLGCDAGELGVAPSTDPKPGNSAQGVIPGKVATVLCTAAVLLRFYF